MKDPRANRQNPLMAKEQGREHLSGYSLSCTQIQTRMQDHRRSLTLLKTFLSHETFQNCFNYYPRYILSLYSLTESTCSMQQVTAMHLCRAQASISAIIQRTSEFLGRDPCTMNKALGCAEIHVELQGPMEAW